MAIAVEESRQVADARCNGATRSGSGPSVSRGRHRGGPVCRPRQARVPVGKPRRGVLAPRVCGSVLSVSSRPGSHYVWTNRGVAVVLAAMVVFVLLSVGIVVSEFLQISNEPLAAVGSQSVRSAIMVDRIIG